MSLPVLRKKSGVKRTVTFDFGTMLPSGDTLTGSATLTPSAGLTATGGTVASPLVTTQVSGGTNGNDYNLRCQIGTTQGQILQLDVTIEVRDAEN